MLSDEQIKIILVEQREFMLKKEFGIERNILQEVDKKIRLPHVIVLTGLRRGGKSTLLRQIIKKYYSDNNFYYINFEDERLFNFPANEFNKIYESLISLFGNKKTFFIDEIQNIPNFETFVRRFYEMGFKFFITGSSANLLSKELGTKLTGRHVDILVKPFLFDEYLRLKKFILKENDAYKTEERAKINKYFEEYLLRGGMPEYSIYNDAEILSKIYDDIILKDIVSRYKVENVSNLKELYQYVITNFANKFSLNSLKKATKIGSVNTIKKYLYYLEETYFVKIMNKFDYSLKKQLVNDKKIYILDNGFVSIISKKINKDLGWLLENLVFNSLNKEYGIFYYSQRGECDFLLVKNKEIERAIQVCWELTDNNREREIKGLLEAMEEYKLKEGLILTNNQEEEIRIKDKKIKIMPVWKWLLVGGD